MTGRMTRQSHFLNDVLKEANQHKRQQKLGYANADQINAVSELVMNKLRGGYSSWQTYHDSIKTP